MIDIENIDGQIGTIIRHNKTNSSRIFGFGARSGKMLLVRIVENIKKMLNLG